MYNLVKAFSGLHENAYNILPTSEVVPLPEKFGTSIVFTSMEASMWQ